MIRVLIDDVPFDVELQIKRNDFLNSKIIDHVADEADTALSPTALTTSVEVKDRDDGALLDLRQAWEGGTGKGRKVASPRAPAVARALAQGG